MAEIREGPLFLKVQGPTFLTVRVQGPGPCYKVCHWRFAIPRNNTYDNETCSSKYTIDDSKNFSSGGYILQTRSLYLIFEKIQINLSIFRE